MGSRRVSKYGDKSFNIILGIGIPYLAIKLMYCHGFLKNKNAVVILKYTKRVLEYYFSKGFTILECNINNLAKLPNDAKQRIHGEETDNSDKAMTFINTISTHQT